MKNLNTVDENRDHVPLIFCQILDNDSFIFERVSYLTNSKRTIQETFIEVRDVAHWPFVSFIYLFFSEDVNSHKKELLHILQSYLFISVLFLQT